ncbi:MAG: VRR-NUC domain-containing protein [Patescibacteria group bacterium]|nr:VRR-NUC domain-containing protein [Patescibacteria group bacterium]
MSTQPEGRLAKKIRLALRAELGGLWVKIHGGPFQASGLPDIVGCLHGRFIGIEVKRPGRENTLTPLQVATLEAIRKSGGIAFMATSPEAAVEMVSSGMLVASDI